MSDVTMTDVADATTSATEDPKTTPSSEPEQIKEEQERITLIGIDFGTEKCVVSLATSLSAVVIPNILNNNFSNQTTPPVVAFKDLERFVGEEAITYCITAPETTIYNIKAVIDGEKGGPMFDEKLPYRAKYHPQTDSFEINYSEVNEVGSRQVVSMILSKLKSFALKYIQQHYPSLGLSAASPLSCVISIPYWWSPEQQQVIIDAAHLASLELVTLVSQTSAATFLHGFNQRALLPPSISQVEFKPENVENNPKVNQGRIVVMIDYGHLALDAQLVELFSDKVVILKAIHEPELGGHVFDSALFSYFEDEIKRVYKQLPYASSNVTDNLEKERKEKKGRAKLEKAVKKVKHTLSTNQETHLEVAFDDQDITLKISKNKFFELSTEYLSRIPQALQKLFVQSNPEEVVYKVEEVEEIQVIGGFIRNPDVNAKISEFFRGKPLAKNLDGNCSVSIGAALLGASLSVKNTEKDHIFNLKYLLQDHTFRQTQLKISNPEKIAEYEAIERKMKENDENNEKRQSLRSNIESYIYEFRQKVENVQIFDDRNEGNKVNSRLEEAENWLYDNDHQHHSQIQLFEQYWDTLRSDLENLAPKAFAKIRELEEQKRKELEEAERLAKLNSDSKDKQPRTDKQRIQFAEKKKLQGNAIFKEFDYAGAASAYATAVGYLEEVYEETEQTKALKISLYSNLAACFIKLDKVNRAIDNCKKVLGLDPKNVKAMFRHGQCLIKLKDWDQADKVLNVAAELEPSNAEIKRELEKVKKEIQKQKEKEKKMYSAMFS